MKSLERENWKETWPLAYFLSLQDRVNLLSVIFTRANRNGRRKKTGEGEKRVEIGRKERGRKNGDGLN